MDGLRASRWFLALAVATASLGVLVVTSPFAQTASILILPWALVVGGPAAIFLLHGPAAEDERDWLRLAAALFPGAALGLGVSDLVRALPREGPTQLVHVVLPLATLAATVPAWRRSDRAARAWMLGSFVLFASLFLLGVAAAGAGFIVLEAALFLGLAGFHRSLRAWTTSAFVGALVLLGGMTLVLLLRGSLWPPRVILDAEEFGLLVVPTGILAVAAACATLLFWRDRPDARRA